MSFLSSPNPEKHLLLLQGSEEEKRQSVLRVVVFSLR